jgi:hypothetical protein
MVAQNPSDIPISRTGSLHALIAAEESNQLVRHIQVTLDYLGLYEL